ncbi:MAG TPA: AraC family transcriptional regulator [Paludibacteraceae bacterium]|nr:AraC family transcriptional regulator [Paludibacteraceae bacterium]
MTATLYYYSLVALFVATSVFGLLFLTQFNENRAAMRNYRIAKRLLAVAFFCVAIGNLVELFDHTGKTADATSQDILLTQIITLSISVTQAFILTLVCVMLLDPKSIKSKSLICQIVAIVLYVVAIVVGYLLLPESAVAISVYLLSFGATYCIILVYFTVYFTRHYRAFRRVMDNFYSDNIAARMRWIAIAFYGALGIGVLALITTQYPNFEISVIFNLFLLCFYTFFGIKLLNYPWQFEIIEMPMMVEETNYEQSLSVSDTTTEIINQDISGTNVNRTMESWISEKLFLIPGITIDDLAKYLGTNRTYLSSHFNSEMSITFRQWINSLRIEEAKRIITNNPKTTMTELTSRLGYADTSTFFRQFKAKEGVQPSVWKQTNLSN